MNRKLHIGIDPGFSGGIAFIDSDGNSSAHKCPREPSEMSDIFFEAVTQYSLNDISCCIEHVHAFPTDGRSSAFKFGYNFGVWNGIISSMDLKCWEVTPVVWQKFFDTPKFKIKKERKRWLKNLAQELFPHMRVTFNISDALLIAEYCRKRPDDA